MSDFVERRKFIRCSSTICHAIMTSDEKIWEKIDLRNISAGGLRFESKEVYFEGQKLSFDLLIYNAFSEFNMQFEGEIVHIHQNGENTSYGVRFININKYYQIQLDEIIRSKVNITDSLSHSLHGHEEGTYTFILAPKPKRTKITSML